MTEPDPYLPTAPAAALAGYSANYFAALRASGKGPRWVRPRGTSSVRYRRSDILAWLEGSDVHIDTDTHEDVHEDVQ